jgi:hypothetical protein
MQHFGAVAGNSTPEIGTEIHDNVVGCESA